MSPRNDAALISVNLPEFLKSDSELSEDFVEKGRPDFASAVDRDRNRPPIRM